MAEKTTQIIQVRSTESFVHRFHGGGGPCKIEIFQEEIHQATLWRVYGECKSVSRLTLELHQATLWRVYGECKSVSRLTLELHQATLWRVYGECKSVSRLTLELHQATLWRVYGTDTVEGVW